MFGFQFADQLGVSVFALQKIDGRFRNRLQDDLSIADPYLELSAGLQPQGFAYRFWYDQLPFGRQPC
jgi:hypothetical protein